MSHRLNLFVVQEPLKDTFALTLKIYNVPGKVKCQAMSELLESRFKEAGMYRADEKLASYQPTALRAVRPRCSAWSFVAASVSALLRAT